MNWDALDIMAAGALICSAAGGFFVVTRFSTGPYYMAAAGLAAITALALVWASLAVGIIGASADPANLMYPGVLAVGAIGALLARFRPGGMARALWAMAGAQIAVGVIALAFGMGGEASAWPGDILVGSALFSLLWGLSATLFRRAAAEATAS